MFQIADKIAVISRKSGSEYFFSRKAMSILKFISTDKMN